jgi:hypothetical protein
VFRSHLRSLLMGLEVVAVTEPGGHPGLPTSRSIVLPPGVAVTCSHNDSGAARVDVLPFFLTRRFAPAIRFLRLN